MDELTRRGYRFLCKIGENQIFMEHVRTGFVISYNCKYGSYRNVYFDAGSEGVPWSA